MIIIDIWPLSDGFLLGTYSFSLRRVTWKDITLSTPQTKISPTKPNFFEISLSLLGHLSRSPKSLSRSESFRGPFNLMTNTYVMSLYVSGSGWAWGTEVQCLPSVSAQLTLQPYHLATPKTLRNWDSTGGRVAFNDIGTVMLAPRCCFFFF